jgi:hypothetical protein
MYFGLPARTPAGLDVIEKNNGFIFFPFSWYVVVKIIYLFFPFFTYIIMVEVGNFIENKIDPMVMDR